MCLFSYKIYVNVIIFLIFFRLMLQLESGLRSLKEFGFSAKDVDEVKGIFADTNIYLLCTTMFVAALHV